MASGWDELTTLIGDRDCYVNRIRIVDSNISIEGEFELPPLAQLSYNDQVFIAMFVRAHGSIKQMEKVFDVSYPTVKARLNKIADQLGFVDVTTSPPSDQILDQLENGEIGVSEALERIRQQ